MNVSEDNMFKIGYTSAFSKNMNNKRRWTSIKPYIKQHKVVFTTLLIFLIALSFNLILLYNFFRIIEKIN